MRLCVCPSTLPSFVCFCVCMCIYMCVCVCVCLGGGILSDPVRWGSVTGSPLWNSPRIDVTHTHTHIFGQFNVFKKKQIMTHNDLSTLISLYRRLELINRKSALFQSSINRGTITAVTLCSQVRPRSSSWCWHRYNSPLYASVSSLDFSSVHSSKVSMCGCLPLVLFFVLSAFGAGFKPHLLLLYNSFMLFFHA